MRRKQGRRGSGRTGIVKRPKLLRKSQQGDQEAKQTEEIGEPERQPMVEDISRRSECRKKLFTKTEREGGP